MYYENVLQFINYFVPIFPTISVKVSCFTIFYICFFFLIFLRKPNCANKKPLTLFQCYLLTNILNMSQSNIQGCIIFTNRPKLFYLGITVFRKTDFIFLFWVNFLPNVSLNFRHKFSILYEFFFPFPTVR